MKKALIIPALFIFLGLASCKKDAPAPLQDDNKEFSTAASKAFSSCGIWHVAIYTPNGTDATSTYGGYQFSFCPDNTLTASNDILTVTGNWYLLLGAGGDKSYFQLDFKSNDHTSRIDELDGMWVIKGLTEDKITLEDSTGATRLVFVLISK